MTIPLAPENTVDLRPVEQLRARTAVAIARLLIILPPARLARLLTRVCRRSRPATYDEALAARTAACSVSIRCAGLGCLQRSVATVLICRMRGASPDWCTGFRTQPFAAHAWVEVDGQAVGEPDGIRNFLTMIAVRHESGNRS